MVVVLSWDVGIKNLSYCCYSDGCIHAWADLDTSIRRGTSLSTTVKKLCDFLDTFCATPQFQSIRGLINVNLIENQPRKNPTMRVVSSILGTYFYVKYGWTPIYYNPIHKLASIDLGQTFDSSRKNKKARWGSKEAASSYRMRKRASIDETRRLLETEECYRNWLTFFERHRKKDDLGDTFLMARAYLKSGGVVEKDESEGEEGEVNEEEGESEVTNCPLKVHMNCILVKQKIKNELTPFGYYKFVLENLLHKEYGTDVTLQQAIQKIMTKSKSKGILDIKSFLQTHECTCDYKCDWVPWMFHEAHWKTLFK